MEAWKNVIPPWIKTNCNPPECENGRGLGLQLELREGLGFVIGI